MTDNEMAVSHGGKLGSFVAGLLVAGVVAALIYALGYFDSSSRAVELSADSPTLIIEAK